MRQCSARESKKPPGSGILHLSYPPVSEFSLRLFLWSESFSVLFRTRVLFRGPRDCRSSSSLPILSMGASMQRPVLECNVLVGASSLVLPQCVANTWLVAAEYTARSTLSCRSWPLSASPLCHRWRVVCFSHVLVVAHRTVLSSALRTLMSSLSNLEPNLTRPQTMLVITGHGPPRKGG